MGVIEDRLCELGLDLPAAVAAPPGVRLPFELVRVDGDLAYVSGHGPFDGARLLVTGRVGAEVAVEQAYEAARATGLSILASLKQELGDLDRVTAWVKALGFVKCAEGFNVTPAAINGFSDLMLALWATPAATRVQRSAPASCRSACRSRSRQSSRSPDLDTPSPAATSLSRPEDRDASDGDEERSRKRHLHHHPRRRIDRERLGEDLVDDRELADVRDEHGRVHHELQPAPARAQNGLDVAHGLARLLAKRLTRKLARLRVDARLAGDVDEIAGAHARRIRPDRRRHTWPGDRLTFDAHDPPESSLVGRPFRTRNHRSTRNNFPRGLNIPPAAQPPGLVTGRGGVLSRVLTQRCCSRADVVGFGLRSTLSRAALPLGLAA
jgi:enamine deaminase RidA (YjgF/YER057c/UK114 family)